MPNFDNMNIGFNYTNLVKFFSQKAGYEALVEKVISLQKELKKYNDPDPDQGNMRSPVSKEDKNALLAAYAQISQEIANLKESGKTNPNLLSTEISSNLDRLEQSINGDTHALINYDPDKGYMNLTHIFESSRPIKVDVTSNQLNKIGGAQSSRIPFKYTAPDGAHYDGFFTESKTFDPYAEAVNEMEKLNGNPELKNVYLSIVRLALGTFKNVVKSTSLEKLDGKFWSRVPKTLLDRIRSDEKVDNKEILSHAFGFYFAKLLDNKKKELTFSNQGINCIMQDLQDLKAIPEFVRAKQYIETHLNDESLQKVFRSIASIDNSAGLHRICGINTGDRIESRNAAMSSVASLLGKPNLIAKAIPMTIIRDGKEIKGCFMSTAQGIDPNQRTEEDMIIRSERVDNSPALASLADLQVLDFICGNIDRHSGNLVYQYDKTTGKMQSVIGIDNDLSFGTYVPKDNHDSVQSLIPLNNMRAMTESMATALEHLTKDQLMQTLAPYDLTPQQMDACWQRTQMLQAKIAESRRDVVYKTGNIEIIPDKDFEKRSAGELVTVYANKKRNIFARPNVLDRPLMQEANKIRKDVSKEQHIYDANAMKSYAIKGIGDALKMEKATGIRGTSPAFENLKTALEEFGQFHKERMGAMMNEADILEHDTRIAEIQKLADIYLKRADGKKNPSTYAKNRAKLVREIKGDFAKLTVRDKLSKEDMDIISKQDERNMDRQGSEMRAKAQVNAMKAYLNYDATILTDLATNGTREEFEDAVAKHILHRAIADKYCDAKMEIKLSDFKKIQSILKAPVDSKHPEEPPKEPALVTQIKESQHFKKFVEKFAEPKARLDYAKQIAEQFKVKENGEMEKSKGLKPEPEMGLNL